MRHGIRTKGQLARAFTVRDLAAGLTCLLLASTLVLSLGGANRSLSQATVCAANLHTLFAGLTAYVNQYNSYPPHNPYPMYAPSETINGLSTSGLDPNVGWILTYGLGLTPPATHANGHFKWYVLNENEVPDVVVCPAADHEKLFTVNPEISTFGLESFLYQYAAFYQTSGICRAATRLVNPPVFGRPGTGGRNAAVPDPTMGTVSSRLTDNAHGGVPSVYVGQRANVAAPSDPSYSNEINCWIQAVSPAEVDDPGRVYYMADSREYRPVPGGWPAAAISDGWLGGWGNKVFLGSRHDGYANVMYLDGTVSRDNQTHVSQWNMNYNATTDQALSSQWRCSTFADPIQLASIGTQHHLMPQLTIKGWEYFFTANGVKAE